MIIDQRPVMLKVAQKQVHSRTFSSLFFDFALDVKPGQFVMAWIPGLDEKPYTISHHEQNRFAITIEAKGRFSKKAVALSPGDLMGFRGPFGNGFNIHSSPHIAVVAGGCGMAPLAPLVDVLEAGGNRDLVLIHGARTAEFLLYPGRFATARQVCTDDGSQGRRALVTDLLEAEILRRTAAQAPGLDMVYACGPEVMMHAVFRVCEEHGMACQVSLERYMRCGFGVCGACACGSQVVCKDGPVFGSRALRTMEDFNTTALLKSGHPVDLTTYFSWRCQ